MGFEISIHPKSLKIFLNPTLFARMELSECRRKDIRGIPLKNTPPYKKPPPYCVPIFLKGGYSYNTTSAEGEKIGDF